MRQSSRTTRAPPRSPNRRSASPRRSCWGSQSRVQPFLERLAWAPDGSALAYTLADPAGGGTDVWIFDRASGELWQLTDTGDAYAGSWVTIADDEAERTALWVSRAEGTVASYLVLPTTDSGERAELIDPAESALRRADHVFQPLVSPNGGLAIYWDGRWSGPATSGCSSRVAHHGSPSSTWTERPMNRRSAASGCSSPTSSSSRTAFTSAAIAWGLDGDSYAVWRRRVDRTAPVAEGEALYPSPERVYFGKASDPRGLTRVHAIDRAVLPAEGSVVDVKVSPTGRHLVVTVRMPTAGDLAVPTADCCSSRGIPKAWLTMSPTSQLRTASGSGPPHSTRSRDSRRRLGTGAGGIAERGREPVTHRVSFAPAL